MAEEWVLKRLDVGGLNVGRLDDGETGVGEYGCGGVWLDVCRRDGEKNLEIR